MQLIRNVFGVLLLVVLASSLEAGEARTPLPSAVPFAEAEEGFPIQSCRELVDGDLETRECLHRVTYGPEGSYSALEIPEGMVEIIATELHWLRPLLEPIFELPVVTGLYTRDARWKDGGASRLVSQRFAGYVVGNPLLTIFVLEIEDHRVRAVEGEIDPEGNGYLRITYSVLKPAREIAFKAGKPDHEVEAPVRRSRF